MDDTLKFLNNLLSLNDKVVIAVSGGPDSICLLHILISLKDKYNLDLICAHVNHNVRKNSKNDEEFVRKFCEERKIIFEGEQALNDNR